LASQLYLHTILGQPTISKLGPKVLASQLSKLVLPNPSPEVLASQLTPDLAGQPKSIPATHNLASQNYLNSN